jgi:hypothetical protein
MKVARSHIVAAIETEKLMFFPKYAIKAIPYVGMDRVIGEFGWTVSVLPTREARLKEKRA